MAEAVPEPEAVVPEDVDVKVTADPDIAFRRLLLGWRGLGIILRVNVAISLFFCGVMLSDSSPDIIVQRLLLPSVHGRLRMTLWAQT